MIIESFLVEEIEDIKFNHYGDYYDRVYSAKEVNYYRIPFDPTTENMDMSISITPVTGKSGLYVNVKTKPLTLDKYEWREEGLLAKRVTIKSKELKKMRADKSDIYFAVYQEKAGEFLIKIDAHQENIRGRLMNGVIEAGFVKDRKLVNYNYMLEVFET